MPPTTEINYERIKEIREEVTTCNDPYNLLAEFVYENERLREKLFRLKSGMCDCI